MSFITFCDFPDLITTLRVKRDQFIEPVDRIRFCIICASISKSAYLLPCDHAMCRTCYTNTIDQEQPRCPQDEIDIDIDAVIVREFNESILLRKEVRCGRTGCPFQGPLETLQAHEVDCIECPMCGKAVNRHCAVAHRASELCKKEIEATIKKMAIEDEECLKGACCSVTSAPLTESITMDVYSMLTSLSNDLNSLKDMALTSSKQHSYPPPALVPTIVTIEGLLDRKLSEQLREFQAVMEPPSPEETPIKEIRDLLESLNKKVDSIKILGNTLVDSSSGSDSSKKRCSNLAKSTSNDETVKPVFHFDLIDMENHRENYDYPERFFLLNGYLLSLRLTLTAPLQHDAATSTPVLSSMGNSGTRIELTVTLSGKKRNWPKERPLMVHLLHPHDESKHRIFGVIPREQGSKADQKLGHCELISREAAERQGYVDNQTVTLSVENSFSEK